MKQRKKPAVKTTPRQTMADSVYSKIRAQLIAGLRLPGEKLTLRGLASEFETSVMPVREAVRRLCAQGGLQLNPNRTLQVSAPTSQQFEEMLQIRAVLEGLACESAVQRMRDSEINRVRQLGQRFEREALRLRPNPETLARLSREMHFAIYHACQMPQLIKLIENLWVQTSPMLTLAIRHTAQALTMREALRTHKRLIENIEQRNPGRARQAMVASIRESAELIMRSGLLLQFDKPLTAQRPAATHRQHKL